MLRMIVMNGGRYQAVEFCGEAVRALSMQERMTLSNMSAELGSQVGLVAPDATEAWLREAGVGTARYRALAERPRRRRRVARFRRRRAGAAGGRPAQPRQCGGCERPCWRGGAGLYRPAPRAKWTTCAPQPPRAAAWRRASSDGGARQPARPERCRARGRAADAAGGAQLPTSRRLRRLRRLDSRRRHGDLDHGAQFQGRMGSETAQVYLASPYSGRAATGRIIDPREVLQ